MSEQIDFEKEKEKIFEGSDTNFLKLEKGNTDITFKDNGKLIKTQKSWDDEEKTYFRATVEVDGEEYIWEMNRGTTPNSKYGQIIRYANAKGGLEGETITWYKQGEGKDTNHILMGLEEVERLAEEEEEEEGGN